MSILIISATALVGAMLAPFRSAAFYGHFQSCMIAVAVGCLTGDAIFHLLPLIFGLHGHGHGMQTVQYKLGFSVDDFLILFDTEKSSKTQTLKPFDRVICRSRSFISVV